MKLKDFVMRSDEWARRSVDSAIAEMHAGLPRHQCNDPDCSISGFCDRIRKSMLEDVDRQKPEMLEKAARHHTAWRLGIVIMACERIGVVVLFVLGVWALVKIILAR